MNGDFRRLWAGTAVSQFGSAVGSVAMPIVAVTELGASTLEVSVLAAVTAVTVLALAFPVGGAVEFRRKRPVLIGSDILRFAALLSVPVAAWAGVLSYVQLCVVAALNAVGVVAFDAGAQAHLKDLILRPAREPAALAGQRSPEPEPGTAAGRLAEANGRLESTRWVSVSAGSALGGALAGLFTVFGALLIDALSFLASAAAVRSIRRPEPAPPAPATHESRWATLTGGLRFVSGHRVLRRHFASWILFAGAVMMSAPLITVYYLRELRFTPLEFGLVMALPSLAGLAGARLAPRLATRLGAVRSIWWTSMARGPWQFLIPLAVPGRAGWVMCLVAFTGVLFFAGMVNTSMSTYRQLATPDDLMARVSSLWGFTQSAAQPVFILAGGLMATVLPVRAVLLAGAVLYCASAVILPRSE